MKKQVNLFLIILFAGLITYAQDSKFSATVGYPIAVGDNFLEQYSSIIDVGAQYRFLEAGSVNIGVSANASFFSRSTTLNTTIKRRLVLVQPRVFGELNGDILKGFRPSLGLGYTISSIASKSENDSSVDQTDSSGAINVNLGVAYDITKNLFAFISYDYLRYTEDFPPTLDNSYFGNASFIKLGAGLRF